jgi:putative DNA primase/helicase
LERIHDKVTADERRAVMPMVQRYVDKISARWSQAGGMVVVRASDAEPKAKDWIWKGHLLRGSQELMSGIPGLGKSQVQIYYTARVTTGLPWPDGSRPPIRGNVIMLTAEDALEQEVIPRLIAAGADRDRVHIIKWIRSDDGKKQRQFLLAEDLERLETRVHEIGEVVLLTVDPITAYMGGKMDSHKATEVRSQLGPLKDFAERTNVAVSTVTHPAKNAGQRAIDQFIGSQAFIAAGRIGHVCIPEFTEIEDQDGKHKVETGRVLFCHAKHNASRKFPTYAFRIEEVIADTDAATGELIPAPRVVWDKDPVEITANEAVADAAGAVQANQRSQVQNEKSCSRTGGWRKKRSSWKRKNLGSVWIN